MNKEIPSEILARLDKAMDALRPSREEVLAKHGNLIAAWQAERQRQRQPAFSHVLCELWQGTVIRVMEGMDELRAGLAELSPAAVTTRGIGRLAAQKGGEGQSVTGSRPERVFLQKGKDCFGRVALQPATGTKVHIQFSLRDSRNKPFKAFVITIRCGDGRLLLDRKQVKGETYTVKDVELADYDFLLESLDGKHHVRMGWQAVRE